jgi:acyl carrier protein
MVHEFVRQWITIHLTGSDAFSSDCTFREVDQSIDSLHIVELMRALEEHLDVDLDVTGISPDTTILDYVKLIHDEYVTAG